MRPAREALRLPALNFRQMMEALGRAVDRARTLRLR